MSHCPDIRMNLAPYLKRALPPDMAEETRRHVARYPACRRELARVEELAAGLEPLDRLRAPDQLRARILSACAAAELRRNRRLAFLRGAALGLAAMLAILVLNPGLRLHDPGPTPRAGRVQPAFTSAQIATARHDLAWTLALTDRVLTGSSKQVLRGIFDRTLPDAVTRSLRQTLTPDSKGNS